MALRNLAVLLFIAAAAAQQCECVGASSKQKSTKECSITGDPHLKFNGKSMSGAEYMVGWFRIHEWEEPCGVFHKIQDRFCTGPERRDNSHANGGKMGSECPGERIKRGKTPWTKDNVGNHGLLHKREGEDDEDNDFDVRDLEDDEFATVHSSKKVHPTWFKRSTSCNMTTTLPEASGHSRLTVDLNGCAWLDCVPVARSDLSAETNGFVSVSEKDRKISVKYSTDSKATRLDVLVSLDSKDHKTGTNRNNLYLFQPNCALNGKKAEGLCASQYDKQWRPKPGNKKLWVNGTDSLFCEVNPPNPPPSTVPPTDDFCLQDRFTATYRLCRNRVRKEFDFDNCTKKKQLLDFIEDCVWDVCGLTATEANEIKDTIDRSVTEMHDQMKEAGVAKECKPMVTEPPTPTGRILA